MDPILPEFGKIAAQIFTGQPNCTYISGTLAKCMDAMEFGSEYWQRHLRDTVRFSEAVRLVWSECKVLIEVGPQPILLGLAMANVPGSNNGTFCPSQRKNEDASTTLLATLKKLYVSGSDLDWKSVYGIRQKYVDLPKYQFEREKYWIVSNTEETTELNPILHPLLGKQFVSPISETVFYQTLDLKYLTYLEDHKVVDCVVLPAAALLECFLAAMREVLQASSQNKFPITIENFKVHKAMPLPSSKCNIQTLVTSNGGSGISKDEALKYQVTLNRKVNQSVGKWKCHAGAEFWPGAEVPNVPCLDLEQLKSALTFQKSMGLVYKALAGVGIQFGPTFRSLMSVWYDSNNILAKIELPDSSEDYICHPVLLDAMIQTSAFRDNLMGAETKALRLPVGIKRFTWFSKIPSKILYAHCSQNEMHSVTLYNDSGEPLAILQGLELIQTSVNSVLRAIREDTLEIPHFTTERWRRILGKLDSRVDLRKMITPPPESPSIQASLNIPDVNSSDQKELLALIISSIFHIFLKAIQECGWPWPNVGELLYAFQWKSLLPDSINPGLVGICLQELESSGYLAEVSHDAYKVLKTLPSIAEADEIMMNNHTRVLSMTSTFEFEFSISERYSVCLPQILKGQLTPLAFFFPADEAEHGVMDMYAHAASYQQQNSMVLAYVSEAIQAYRDLPPNDGVLRILEVGAGTGSTSLRCLELLRNSKIPFHYTFTDISPAFLNEAKKKLGQGPEMTYQVFNIEQDPLVQGYSPEEFDVIIGVQVVHATASIDESLVNLKKVLRVGGMLVLGETFVPFPMITFLFGMLDGYSRYNDFRLNEKTGALLNAEQWSVCLEQAEFDRISWIQGFSTGVIAARNATKFASTTLSEKTWLLVDDGSQLHDKVAKNILCHGRDVLTGNVADAETLHNVCNEGVTNNLEGIVCFLTAFDSTDIVKVQIQIVNTLLTILKTYEAKMTTLKELPKLVVVTRGVYNIGDSEPGNPFGASAWGVLKSFRAENHTARISLIDLDPQISEMETSQVISQIWSREDDLFVAFRGNQTYALGWIFLESQAPPIQLPNTDRYEFINPTSGNFADIDIGPVGRQQPIEDEVEVEVRATALNFRDLLMVMKPEGFEMPDGSVGLDVSGVVVALGPNATRLKVGDEVFGFALHGALGSHFLSQETRLMKIPEQMTFVEACTIPCALATAQVSLVDEAGVKPSDRVLIHVATGGVGLAAIQVLNSIGAEIYATAGSKRKRAYLRNLGTKYVYNSRDTSYGDAIERDTHGAGVTVVLNSLTGPGFKETSLRICSQGARFLEIAKINIWAPAEVKILRPDVKYTVVDLSHPDVGLRDVNSVRPIDIAGQMARIEKLVADGAVRGLPNVIYPLSKVREAFQYFQKAHHIGKIVVQIPKCIISDIGKLEHKHLIFNSRSSYLITGGLGGIGIEVAKWMISMGARSIVLLSRRLPSETLQRSIDDWNRRGSNIVILQADIAEYDNCKTALELIKDIGLPSIRGIMHAAGLAVDAAISNQTLACFEAVMRPKVYGGWYLHNLTLNDQLEFFVMFSSMSGIVGMMGQTNYTAANRFMDALAHYRISIGLPATTINWGGWSEVGTAARMSHSTDVISGMRMFTPAQGIASLNLIMTSRLPQVAVSEVTDTNLINTMFCQGRFTEELKSDSQDDGGKSAQLESLVETIKQEKSSEERKTQIQAYIELVLKATLSLPTTAVLDIDQNFYDLGVDSLMGMEMKSRIQSLLGDSTTLSINSMQENPTIRGLSALVSELMENDHHIQKDTSSVMEDTVLEGGFILAKNSS